MCGIVGITSNKQVTSSIINSLKKLEYRGYDSAGIATLSDGFINEVKCEGRVDKLEKNLSKIKIEGTVGIGHVRWATHGSPNTINAHPHSSEKVSVVHNGIIENSTILKKILEKKGYNFKSQTDTEVIAYLVTDYLKKNNLKNTIIKVLKKLHGSFALGIIFKDHPDLIIGARRGSPLAVGYGPSENYLGSDSYALKSMTNKISYLSDGEFCLIKENQVEFFDPNGKKVNKEILNLSQDNQNYEKGDYKHFMAKEIDEQPITIKNCVNEYVDKLNRQINIYNFPWKIDKISSVVLIGCGTAYHSCLVAKYWFEELTSLDVNIDIASEFRYRKLKFKKDCLYVFVSQSGETADTYAALDICKKNKMKTCSIVNVVESSIARDSDFVLPIHCGPEIGVASTKAFTSQVAVLALITLFLKYKFSNSYNEQNKVIESFSKLSKNVDMILDQADKIKDIANRYSNSSNFLYLGRGYHFPVALEGALKLKEISYIHAEGYPAAEMKHGPIALIDDKMPVVFIVTKSGYEKIVSNIREVKSRGGKIIIITSQDKEELKDYSNDIIYIPETHKFLSPIISSIPLQLLAYYVAVFKGCDVDQPRNLAKSVTVE